jgi:hypothetical protein
LIRIADEEPFKNAHVVRSRGHIAAANFRDGRFLACCLQAVCPR